MLRGLLVGLLVCGGLLGQVSSYPQAAGGGGGDVSSVAGRTGAVTLVGSDITSCRPTGQGTGTVTIAACTIARGNNPVAQLAAATIALSGTPANETCEVFISSTDALVVECVTLTGRVCTNCTLVTSATPSIPDGAFPVATITNTSTSWTTVTDNVPDHWLYTVEGGDGQDCTMTAGILTCAVDSTVRRTTGAASAIPHTQYFPATGINSGGTASSTAGWYLPSTNPAVAATLTVSGSDRIGAFNFADGANDLSVLLHTKLPSTWTGSIDVVIPYSIAAGGTNFRVVLSTLCRGVGEAVSGGTFTDNAAQVIAAATSSGTIQNISMTGIDVSTCSAGEMLFLKVARTPTHADDTATQTLSVLGMEVTIRTTGQ